MFLPTPDDVEFTALRAQGAGGQHVNKTESAVQLRFDIRASSLSPAVKERLLALRDRRITPEGAIVIKAQEERSQQANRSAALERLHDLVRRASIVPGVRKATKPTRASRKRRLDGKTHRGRVKTLRRTVDD